MTDDKVSIDVLAAVQHPVRRRIVEYLVFEGPSQVGAMAKAFDEQVGSISHHLRMLERAGVVERAPELATDGRTSWWRYLDRPVSWAVDDFADNPAELHRVRVAERLVIEHNLEKLSWWKQHEASYGEEWRRAAFSMSSLARCTPDELADLTQRLLETVITWRDEVAARDDDQERRPVYTFSYGFPTQP